MKKNNIFVNELMEANRLLSDDDLYEEEGIEIFFDDLDEDTQKKVMASLTKALNATEDDEYANKKIIEKLAKSPLFVVIGQEIVRELNIDI